MGSLTVHVLDYNGSPIAGKRVGCHFQGLIGTHDKAFTDDGGTAYFDVVPVGTVDVYVNGEWRVQVRVGSGDHEDVTVTP